MADPTSSRARRIRKRILIAAVTFGVALLCAEVGLRVAQRIDGRPFDVKQTKTRVRELLYPIQQFVPANVGIAAADGSRRPVLNPYYGAEDEHDTGGVMRYFRERGETADFVILLVGGSVAAALGSAERENLEEALARRPEVDGRRVVLLNGAHAAHKEPQMVSRLALLLAFGYRPDAVLALDGFNETALALENAASGTNPLWPSAPVWGAVVGQMGTGSPERMDLLVRIWQVQQDSRSLVEWVARFGLHYSALGSKYVLSRLESMNRQRNGLQSALMAMGETADDPRTRRQTGGPDFDPGDVLAMSVDAWSESSRSLRALCDSRGIPYVHVLQAALFDEDSKPMSEAESRIKNPNQAWLRGARAGYPMLRAAATQLVEGGETFLDASRMFADVEETVYVDPCHLNGRGNELLRDFILQNLSPNALRR